MLPTVIPDCTLPPLGQSEAQWLWVILSTLSENMLQLSQRPRTAQEPTIIPSSEWRARGGFIGAGSHILHRFFTKSKPYKEDMLGWAGLCTQSPPSLEASYHQKGRKYTQHKNQVAPAGQITWLTRIDTQEQSSSPPRRYWKTADLNQCW